MISVEIIIREMKEREKEGKKKKKRKRDLYRHRESPVIERRFERFH